MTAMNPSTEAGPVQSESGEAAEVVTEPVVSILVGAAPSDRCPICSAEMAGDQRYCVECGTRRGKPRFQLASAPSRPVAATSSRPSQPGVPQRVMVLLALIVVLLALGVGILIGNSAGGNATIKGPVTVVLRGSAGTGAAGGGTATSKAATPKTVAPAKAKSNFFGS